MTFKYEGTPEGGRVKITTSDPKATRALHELLRYQIREHGLVDRMG